MLEKAGVEKGFRVTDTLSAPQHGSQGGVCVCVCVCVCLQVCVAADKTKMSLMVIISRLGIVLSVHPYI